MNRQTAIKYRKRIEQAAISLPDQDALSVPELFPHWRENMTVSVDDRICYADKLYCVVQAHTTQAGWEPDKIRHCSQRLRNPVKFQFGSSLQAHRMHTPRVIRCIIRMQKAQCMFPMWTATCGSLPFMGGA